MLGHEDVRETGDYGFTNFYTFYYTQAVSGFNLRPGYYWRRATGTYQTGG